MVSENDSHGVTDQQSWCSRIMVMVLGSNDYGVSDQRSWCQRVTVMVVCAHRSLPSLAPWCVEEDDNGPGRVYMCVCVCVCVCVCLSS
jgi:hypothetical protein